MKIHRAGREYVQCEMCEAFAKEKAIGALGWDWFTGTLGRTHHYCKKHKATPQHDRTMEQAGVKP